MQVTSVEILPEMHALLSRNVLENNFSEVMFPVLGDVRDVDLGDALFDWVVFNPPYFKAGSGQPSKSHARDVARYERCGTMRDFVVCAARYLVQDGSMTAIVPASRALELQSLMIEQGFLHQHVCMIHTYENKPARHALISAKRSSLYAIDEEAPLITHLVEGGYTPEVLELLK